MSKYLKVERGQWLLILNNFSRYLLSDIALALLLTLTLSAPQKANAMTAPAAVYGAVHPFVRWAVLLSGNPKTANFVPSVDWFQVEQNLVSGPNRRVLVKVVSRRPKACYHDEAHKELLYAYVTEIFDCGHSRDFHFIADVEPLIARTRVCHECTGAIGKLRLTPKKPSAPVPSPAISEKKEAA